MFDFQVFITDSFLATIRRQLRVVDFRDNPTTCDVNVVKFVKLTIERPGKTT